MQVSNVMTFKSGRNPEPPALPKENPFKNSDPGIIGQQALEAYAEKLEEQHRKIVREKANDVCGGVIFGGPFGLPEGFDDSLEKLKARYVKYLATNPNKTDAWRKIGNEIKNG